VTDLCVVHCTLLCACVGREGGHEWMWFESLFLLTCSNYHISSQVTSEEAMNLFYNNMVMINIYVDSNKDESKKNSMHWIRRCRSLPSIPCVESRSVWLKYQLDKTNAEEASKNFWAQNCDFMFKLCMSYLVVLAV